MISLGYYTMHSGSEWYGGRKSVWTDSRDWVEMLPQVGGTGEKP